MNVTLRLKLLFSIALLASIIPVPQGHGFELICKEPPERVYILRHTEREDQSPDSSLSRAGVQRAVTLVETIGDEPIKAIYTTRLKRTIETATPLATYKNIEIQPLARTDIMGLLSKICETAGGTVVVVGHSGTIPIILSLFELKPDHPEYGDLYILDFDDQGVNLKKGWFGSEQLKIDLKN